MTTIVMSDAQPVIKQINSKQNQAERPVLAKVVDTDNVGGVQQQNETQPDQQDRAHRKSSAARAEIKLAGKLFHRDAVAPLSRGMVRLKNHIEHPRANHDADKRVPSTHT